MNEIFIHTDLYQLNMCYTYFTLNQHKRKSVFEVYFRISNKTSGHHIFAGLEQIIELIENFRITEEEILYLEKNFDYSKAYLDYLRELRFSGNIESMYEGDVIFANEPMLVVKASIVEALLLETAILNIINYQTLIASIASNITVIDKKSGFSEFGARRAYGLEAATLAARSSYIGGFDGTSLVRAAKKYDIPATGTHSHAFVQSYETEYEAFYAYATTHKNVVFLIDTYDVLNSGLKNAIAVYRNLNQSFNFVGVRLDSGNLLTLSKKVRKVLDEEGLNEVKIIASNDLDKEAVSYLTKNEAPIDIWGIGTKLVTAADRSSLGCVYKLVQIENECGKMRDVIKISADQKKTTTPGSKKVFRIFAENKAYVDIICSEEEIINVFKVKNELEEFIFENIEIKSMLNAIIVNGKLVYKIPSVKDIKKYCSSNKSLFSEKILKNEIQYKIIYSKQLLENKTKLQNQE